MRLIVTNMAPYCQSICNHNGTYNWNHLGNNAHMNRIGHIRKRLGWSYEKLAQEVERVTGVHTSRQQMMKLEKGDRRLSDVWLERLSPAMGVTKAELLGESPLATVGTIPMRLMGEVQAGAWKTALEYEYDDQETYGVPVENVKLADRMFLLKARGDSMNLADIPNGALLICVKLSDFVSHWRDLKSGDKIIVHQVDGDLYEATVKELDIRPDGVIWLLPKSDNPEHQAIRIENQEEVFGVNDQAREICVHAVVLGRAVQMFVD